MQKLSVSDLFSWSSVPIDFPEGIAADAALSLIEVSLSAAPIPVLMTHTQFASDGPVISYANPAFCLSTGYFLHELINAPISKLRGPKSDRRVQKQLVSDVLSSGSFEGEDVNYRKDGSEYTVRWSVVPIRDAAGNTVRYLSFQTHTDRVRGTTVAESGNLLELLFHSNGAGICLINENRQFVRINPACVATLGYPEEELLAGSFLLVIRPEERDRVAKRIDEFLAGQGESISEYTILQKNGEPRRIIVASERLVRRDQQRYQLCTITDITERYRAEKHLQERERLLRSLFDVAPVGILVTRPDDRIFDANAAMLDMLGRSRGPLSKLTFRSLTHPAAKANELAQLEAIDQGHADQVQLQKTILRPDGSEFLAEQSTRAVRSPSQRIDYFVHAVTDVTIHEANARRLKESESLLRRVTASVPGAVYRYTVRKDGTDYFQFLSEGAAQLFELPIAELMDEPRKLFAQFREDSLQAGTVHRDKSNRLSPSASTIRYQLPSGKTKYIYDQSIPEPLADDGSMTWNGTFTDLTHLRVAKAKLRARLDQLQAIGDNLPDGVVFRMEVDTEQAVRYLYFSKGAEQVLGTTARSLIDDARLLEGLIFSADRAAFVSGLRQAVSEDVPFSFEARVRFPTGKIHWTQWRGRPHSLADGRTWIDGIIFDITERKSSELKLEAARQQEQEMQVRLQELSQFESASILAGSVAHDFNNLMTAVLGFSDLAANLIPEGGTLNDYLTSINVAATRATELCRQLLGVAGKRQQPDQPLDLSEIVREMSSLLSSVVPKTIQMERDLAEALPAIIAEPTQLRQIVMNLITNAAQAITSRVGVIRLSTTVVIMGRLDLEAANYAQTATPGRFVLLEVSDTGDGIPPDVIERIFNPYFTTKSTGHGLGLAAVRGIMLTLRGVIRIQSKVGQGSLFQLFFPATTSHPKPPSYVVRLQSTIRRAGDVLVVRSPVDDYSVIEATLKSAGYQVTLVVDSVEGSKALAEGRDFVAVVIDLYKPEVQGAGLMKNWHFRVTKVPTVILAGHLPEDFDTVLGDDPRVAILAKPYLPSDLLDAISSVRQG